jgi:hypothetical protein
MVISWQQVQMYLKIVTVYKKTKVAGVGAVKLNFVF